MQDFHTLQIWQKSHELTLKIYKATKQYFPKEEMFALTSQIRRASSSIACNIAEGCGRKTNADFSHFLQMSIGSCSEVEYQILLAKDLGYLPREVFTLLTEEVISVRKMIINFQKKIEQ